jgi:D-alanyl-lipoteichoic acid acyltransferase DltB (MBOAT superfamily)
MTLVYILVFLLGTLLLGVFGRGRVHAVSLLVASSLAVFALQSPLPIRGLDFWLPCATLSLVVLSWILTTPRSERHWQRNWPTAAILGGIILLLGLTRDLGIALPFTASRPPELLLITGFFCAILIAGAALNRFTVPGRMALGLALAVLVVLFAVLKIPALSIGISRILRSWNGQTPALASPLDLSWLGFSYLAFRLMHTLRDRQTGRMPVVSLQEYAVYVIFFPALVAGPIDRVERFVADLRQPAFLAAEDWALAGKRIALGLFKKFALADSLALIALNGTNALQVRAAGWGWVLLYAYALEIYLDFSGYTDIALGLARLLGIHLPENFDAPYFKPNLTQFWNSWHMTLTQWFRSYFFNPLTRYLRTRKKPLPLALIIFMTQTATMVLVGLWHGVTLNFALWGLWHGLGLFINNRWSELTKARVAVLPARMQQILKIGGILLTFHFVCLGWVFFALPSPAVSLHFIRVLVGLG